MWGHLKQHEIANLCVKEAWQLSLHATAALRQDLPAQKPA